MPRLCPQMPPATFDACRPSPANTVHQMQNIPRAMAVSTICSRIAVVSWSAKRARLRFASCQASCRRNQRRSEAVGSSALVAREPVKAGQGDRVSGPVLLNGGKVGMRSYQPPVHVFERPEGIVPVRPEVIAKSHTLLPFTRIAVDAAKQEVGPCVPKGGPPDFWLNMLDGQMSLNLSLAVAAVVAKTVPEVVTGILVTRINGRCSAFVNGPHRHLHHAASLAPT